MNFTKPQRLQRENTISVRRLRLKAIYQAGFSLIEVCFAAALLALLSTGVMAVHSQVLGLLRNCKDNISASQALQQRVEQMRIANWSQITDANQISALLQNLPMPSISGLGAPKEVITVTPYPEKAGVDPVQVTRQQGTVQVISNNSALKGELIVQIDIRLSWKGFPNNRARIRGTTVLFAQGGITK